VTTLIDSGCQSYGLIDRRTANSLHLDRLPLEQPIGVKGFNEERPTEFVKEVAVINDLDIGGSHTLQQRVFLYVVPRLDGVHSIILGRPWMKYERAHIDPDTDRLHIRRTGVSIGNLEKAAETFTCKNISAVSFTQHHRRSSRDRARGKPAAQVFAASLADIEKALRVKEYIDPRTKLPPEYWKFLPVCDRKEADKLPPLRGPGTDHKIELEKNPDGTDKQPPWGPLYNMSRDELLVLRKTLTELLDKGFIRVSHSPAASPVLFVSKKGSAGLRFCVDYRALNLITRKDRYPLPLIRETLNNISKAKWFTKVDIIAAFNKLRIREGDEWLTAFRTRFGLFEWLVTPFGLANAPSTFQRYINWVLREFLDDFASAYVDDILIYTNGSLAQHRQHVGTVLEKLMGAGLQIDIEKSEFHVQSTKYLGFIIEAGKGLRMDPEKIKAIKEWAKPTSVKGVRGFLGFANFYRRFIKDFSTLCGPLTDLTKTSNGPFYWTSAAELAFEALKAIFSSAPMLAQWDPDRETVLETDCSGWAAGAALMQYDDDGQLRPVAFFSKKLSPAECNYEIYDKEMLAVIVALKEWRAELKSVTSFKIITDHKNLEYFMTARHLSERQMRWSLVLSEFNYQLAYRPGKLAVVPDALSRRDQDIPQGVDDDRTKARYTQLLKPEVIQISPAITEEADAEESNSLSTDLQKLWDETVSKDKRYQDIREAVKREDRLLPIEYRDLRVSMADLSIGLDNALLYRNRRWVPDSEPLQTSLVQQLHDSVLTGHPGKEGLIAILRRRYHWPYMTLTVRQFVRNCMSCGRNTVWRNRTQGLLQPLPIPDRVWSEISMDYIVDLPRTKSGKRHILVITDRLGKGPMFIPCKNLEGKTLARKFIKHYLPHHSLPRAITSDRGDQFVKGIWGEICNILNIKQRLSTAYHPQTDGSTERMNQTLEEYLRHFCNHYQNDWDEFLPLAQIAISSRDANATGMSPFFLTHGYHPNTAEGFNPELVASGATTDARKSAQAVVNKLKSATNLAQTLMAHAQQLQEDIANRKRDPAPTFEPGDRVWLDLRNIQLDRPKKKIAEQHAIYTVLKRISPGAYRLNTPSEIHNVFPVSLLKPVAQDPLPSQIQDDVQPPAILVDGEEEYGIEYIESHRTIRGRGRGGPKKRQYLCKWKGYAVPTWNDEANVRNTIALDQYEARLERKISDVDVNSEEAEGQI
jgi:hypothetical protein